MPEHPPLYGVVPGRPPGPEPLGPVPPAAETRFTHDAEGLLDALASRRVNAIVRAALPGGSPAERDLALADAGTYGDRLDALAAALDDPGTGVYAAEGRHSLLSDLAAVYDPAPGTARAAADRLGRHRQLAAIRGAVSRATGRRVRGDVTSTNLGGTVPPGYIAEEASGPREAAPLVALWEETGVLRPLPGAGVTVQVAQMATAVAAGVQSAENTGLTEVNISTSDVPFQVATTAAYCEISMQTLQRGGPAVDATIGGELVRAVRLLAEGQFLNGSGSGGQLFGLMNATSATAVASSTFTPTSVVATVWEAARQTARVRQGPATTVVLPRETDLWLRHAGGGQGNALQRAEADGLLRVVPTYSAPSSSTTGKAAVWSDLDIDPRWSGVALSVAGPPRFRSADGSGLANALMVRVTAAAYIALPVRRPGGIGVLSGAGLALPTSITAA